jgi:hypothetical protein
MSLFSMPSIWELLFPNWNFFTKIGIAIIVLSLLVAIFIPIIKRKWPFFGILIGILLIFGFSILEDLWATVIGKMIFIFIVVIIALAMILGDHEIKK